VAVARRRVEEGRRALGEAEQAAGVLRAGLDLWRGPALADFAHEPFAQAAITQAEELRLAAIEERVEADLALGRHGELVAELQALVEHHPLRERARGQLMLALYRCGRQAEALQAYQAYRKAMAEQLGLDPSPALRQLEESILKRDLSLDLPVDHQPASAPVSERTSPGRRVPRLALAGVTVVALAVLAAIVVSSRAGPAALSVIPPDSIGALSPGSGSIVAQAPIGASPSALASGTGAIWAANYNAATVSRIDPTIHTVIDTIPVDSTPSAIAVGAGDVWVANTFSGTVSRIDPGVHRVVQTIGVGNGPSGVAVGFGSVWVANSSDGTLSRINAVSGAPQSTILLGGGATDVAAGLRAVWISDEANRRVLRVNPETNQVTDTIDVGNGPTAIAIGFDSVWVANSLDDTVSRIDPQTDSVSPVISVGKGPNAIAVGSGAVWVTNEFAGSVSRIDPTTNVTRTIEVGNRPQGVAVAGGLVWIGAQPAATSHRGGTLTALSGRLPKYAASLKES
jgi:YVTN family beta-propeller protein